MWNHKTLNTSNGSVRTNLVQEIRKLNVGYVVLRVVLFNTAKWYKTKILTYELKSCS